MWAPLFFFVRKSILKIFESGSQVYLNGNRTFDYINCIQPKKKKKRKQNEICTHTFIKSIY